MSQKIRPNMTVRLKNSRAFLKVYHFIFSEAKVLHSSKKTVKVYLVNAMYMTKAKKSYKIQGEIEIPLKELEIVPEKPKAISYEDFQKERQSKDKISK